ncbi:hypothetical protein GGI04_003629, partial [Coemansia thaxteri]
MRNSSGGVTTLPASHGHGHGHIAAKTPEIAGDDSVFYPQLLGQAIDYYFYPNSSVPVFCPTSEQFASFEALVAAIEPLALRGGICKIIPPRKWRQELEAYSSAGSSGGERVFDEAEFPIMKPIVQHFNGSRGIFHQYNVEFHRKLRLAQFFQTSQDASHRAPDVKPKDDDGDNKKKQVESAPPDEPCQSETVGIAVDYATGRVRLTSAAAEALREGTRSEAQRAKFDAATAQYRVQPDTENDEAAADHNGVRPGRQFTPDDGRALFVGSREYAENEELERMYWKNLLFQPPMYGADVLGSLFPEEANFPTWNIRRLPGLLRLIGQRMPGVNDPYLYLGMWKATFAWHVEDMDLYSINYIHFGAPKAWYAIPVDSHSRFEMSMQNVFANDHKACPQFLRHKAFLLSPHFLAQQGIPFHRVVQRAGEIVLTFPHGYHAGFNHGFNCAESVNFALDRWLDVAWDSKHCECVKDSVTIDLMRWFGDVHRDRLRAQRQQQQQQESSKSADQRRVSPRRHAAAAAAAAPPVLSGGVKRKPSSAAKPTELAATRSPKRVQVDAAMRRLASLHTPVGTCGGCLRAVGGGGQAAAVVECQQCGLTVHPQCAGLACDDGAYRCANCVMDTDQLACSLCAFQNGVLLPLKRPSSVGRAAREPTRFAHLLCATFVPDTYLEFPPTASPSPPGVCSGALVTPEMLANAKTAPLVLHPCDPPSQPQEPKTDSPAAATRSRTAAGRGVALTPAALPAGPMRYSARVCGVPAALVAPSSGDCVICSQDDSDPAFRPLGAT